MLDKERKANRDVHVKRELVLRIEVGIGKFSVHLGVCPRHSETNTCQHIVGRNPVDVVLVDLRSDDYTILILILFPLSFARSLLSNVFCPTRGIFVLGNLIEVHV